MYKLFRYCNSAKIFADFANAISMHESLSEFINLYYFHSWFCNLLLCKFMHKHLVVAIVQRLLQFEDGISMHQNSTEFNNLQYLFFGFVVC